MKLQAIPPKLRFVDNNGIALAGGKVYTYDGGTTTPKATYTDYDGATPNANPVILDSRGEAGIWLSEGLYKFVVKDSADSTIYTVDDLSNDPVSSTTDFAASTGAALVGRIDSATGAVSETVQTVLRRSVHISSFNPPTDETSDALTALTNFYNSANSRPGVPHYLDNRTYCISGPLPETNVSNVKIYGVGCHRHDIPPAITGTRIKAIGTVGSWAGKVMRKVEPIAGVSAQHLSNHVEAGICYDANDIAEKAFSAKSCFKSEFDIGAVEAIVQAATFGVVDAGGGESFDMQLCKVTLTLNQAMTTAADHYGAVFEGNTTANFSLNNVYVNGFHMNVPLLFCEGTDNNDWWVRPYGAGTATESWSMVGGATDAESTRNERINLLTGNLPLHVYGTAYSTFPARDIYIYVLDKGNGTPDPVVETGGSCYWQNNASSPIGDTPPVSFTPTITAGSGTFANATASGIKLTRGKKVDIWATITVTDATGASVSMDMSLGDTVNSSISGVAHGVRANAAGVSLIGRCGASDTKVVLVKSSDGTFPAVTGAIFDVHVSFIKA